MHGINFHLISISANKQFLNFRQQPPYFQTMDHKTLQNQLKNCKVREGPLYKRSKFLKEWRERWIVLTMNYLFTFTNKTCKQVTDIIDLKQMKSYKSYLRKDDEMIPAGFKVRSDDNQFYFCGRNSNEKWSWLVTIQRLMDYKYAGSSTYNNIEFIKTRGFCSQVQFENGGKVEKSDQPTANLEVSKSAQEAKKQVDNEVEKIMKELQNQKQQLKVKEIQFNEKQKLLQQQQQALKKQQEEKFKELQKKTIGANSSQNKNVVQKNEEKIIAEKQTRDTLKTEKTNEPDNFRSSTKVSELKNLFQQKIVETCKQTTPAYKLTVDLFRNLKKKSKTDELSTLRARTVTDLFEQFHEQNPQPLALKYVLDFLVKMASNTDYGYYVSIVAEAKSHKNRSILAETFVQLITDFKDIQNCDTLVKFIQICVFQAPGFFNNRQISIIQSKLVDFMLGIQSEQKMEDILKNMFIVNTKNKYQKNQLVKSKLNRLIKEGKREETKNWARKLVDQF